LFLDKAWKLKKHTETPQWHLVMMLSNHVLKIYQTSLFPLYAKHVLFLMTKVDQKKKKHFFLIFSLSFCECVCVWHSRLLFFYLIVILCTAIQDDHLVGEFSCCFKNSGCGSQTACGRRDDAMLCIAMAGPVSGAWLLRMPPDLQRIPLCLGSAYLLQKIKCSN
jgi:hypothetical protein